jgi:rRNA maturation endonuclease Nob1
MNFSLENVKGNLKGLVCAFLGLFHFIWMAIPYGALYASMGDEKHSENFSGYKMFDGELFFDPDSIKVGFLGGIFQILALICAIVLAVSAVYLLVKAFFGVELPEQFGPVQVSKVRDLSMLAYAAANLLVLLSMIIISIANNRTEELWGMKLSAGISLGFGLFLVVFLSVGAFVAFTVIEKKYPELLEGGSSEKTIFVCDQCGASAKKGAAFCGACGGSVSEKVVLPTIFVCSGCGAKAKKGVAFCAACGGQVVEQLAPPPTMFACSSCGAKAKKGVAFCSKCGGQIIEKPIPTYVCEACGEPSKKDVSFCAKCGGKIIEK